MKTTKTAHQSWTTAITFAEAGEWETARSYMPVSRRNKLLAWLENLCVAVTFAEEGMQDEAVRIMVAKERESIRRPVDFMELCGMGKVNCTYGLLSPGRLGVN